ncbi:tRNA lysidine(34) synthetase TilS [Treponema saccharophilum]|uniref:tRNA lysidine(34) synthetase TilS n=1 Tax=Treponema saccharophilum TaxID=165 RepID=UPI003865CD39
MEFLDCVRAGLLGCGIDVGSCRSIGAAVSGGADSVSLLVSLAEIFGAGRVRAVTVNHNIRPDDETRGDAEFVRDLCARLGVACDVVEIPRGKVCEVASERGGGIEEAARFLRYGAFDSFVEKSGVEALCLAHNENDQLETVLMRFIQGSGTDGGGGIRMRRGVFVRPLLSVSRSMIEEFLRSRSQPWRTDSTNSDTGYMRNRIRANLVPFLDAQFPGWRGAVIRGAGKVRDDDDFIDSAVVSSVGKNASSVSRARWDSFPPSIRRRAVQSMLLSAGFSARFPYALMGRIVSVRAGECDSVSFGGFSITADENSVRAFRLDSVEKTRERGFCRSFSAGGRRFVERSVISGDCIAMKDGRRKDVQKILSEWKVPRQSRQSVPVVVDAGTMDVVAVLAGGYGSWIVGEFRAFLEEAGLV